MTREEIFNKVKAIVAEKLGVPESDVVETAGFATDLSADSLDTVELIMDFERVFECEITDQDAEHITTVKDAVDFIEAHIK